MPGSVQAATASTVMPWTTASLFQQSRSLYVDTNVYPDGSMQTRLVNAPLTSRKSWIVSPRCTAAQLTAIRNFYNASLGPTISFYFYDVYETVPIFSYDNTGVTITGRYIVRFRSSFTQVLQIGRHAVTNLQLIEVS